MDSARPRGSNEVLQARLGELKPEALVYGEVKAAKHERRADALRAASLQVIINAVGTVLAAGVLYPVAQLSGLLAGIDWISVGFLAAMALGVGFVVIEMGREARLPKNVREFRAIRLELHYREIARKISVGEPLTAEEERNFLLLQAGGYSID